AHWLTNSIRKLVKEMAKHILRCLVSAIVAKDFYCKNLCVVTRNLALLGQTGENSLSKLNCRDQLAVHFLVTQREIVRKSTRADCGPMLTVMARYAEMFAVCYCGKQLNLLAVHFECDSEVTFRDSRSAKTGTKFFGEYRSEFFWRAALGILSVQQNQCIKVAQAVDESVF